MIFLYLLWSLYNYYLFLLRWYITYWFVNVEPSCVTGIKLSWSYCVLLLMYYWIQPVNILLRIFPYMFIRDCYLVTRSCPTLCDPMDYSPPGSPVHRVLQGRILEWVTISFSTGSSHTRDWTIFCIGKQILFHWTTREDLIGDIGL